MKISISSLAWDVPEDESVAALLRKYGIDTIDIVPNKYFPELKKAEASEIARVREDWDRRGIKIAGMQALLFEVKGLNLFGAHEMQKALLTHLEAVCRIGAGLGAGRLVFGSPKNRDRSLLTDEEARRTAVDFFRRLGGIAAGHGMVICLEPNPACYGSNFMMNSADTASIVSEVGHAAIRMQFDTGALTINHEDPFRIVAEYAPLIGHVHASEPDLVTLGDGKTDHAKAASALRGRLPDQIVSIEMLPAKKELNLAAIERALGVAIKHYRGIDHHG